MECDRFKKSLLSLDAYDSSIRDVKVGGSGVRPCLLTTTTKVKIDAYWSDKRWYLKKMSSVYYAKQCAKILSKKSCQVFISECFSSA